MNATPVVKFRGNHIQLIIHTIQQAPHAPARQVTKIEWRDISSIRYVIIEGNWTLEIGAKNNAEDITTVLPNGKKSWKRFKSNAKGCGIKLRNTPGQTEEHFYVRNFAPASSLVGNIEPLPTIEEE